MAVRVQLKNKETGALTEHFSVDAADILAQGGHVQVGGLKVAFTPNVAAPPKKEIKPVAAPVAAGRAAYLKKVFGGKYNVIGADGSIVNAKSLSKADAEALLATLQ